jgi:CPA2 family monovalent cation:H+ antiporter-2
VDARADEEESPVTHEIPVLRELILLAGASLAVVLLFRRLRLPATIGFIVTGILIGPGAFALVHDPAVVSTLAEFGVVVLLFTVGLEFSFADLRRLGRRALVGGALQVLLTVAVVAAALVATGRHPARALFVGMLVSLSSTAVVLKLLTDRIELRSPHGRVATAVLLFQDLAAVVFLLAVTPLGRWAAGRGLGAAELAAGLPRAALLLAAAAAALLLGRRAVPWLLGRASRAGSREIFLFGVLLVVLGSASLASRLGSSLAVGAFLAGLVLAGSELRDLIGGELLPLRDVLASVFFIAVGMSLDPATVLARPGLVALSTAGLVLAKLGLAYVALRAGGVSGRVACAAALTLAQVGEFSFVLLAAGAPLALVTPSQYQLTLAATVVSMLLAPFLIAQAVPIAERLGAWAGRVPLSLPTAELPAMAALTDHVIVVGYGLNGRNLVRALRAASIPYVVLEQNAQSVRRGRDDGEPIFFGDGTHPEVLERVGVHRARVVVFAIAAVGDERRGVAVARRLAPQAHLVVRTRYVREIEELQKLGANEVVPEEFETSLEMFSRVLRRYGVPSSAIRAEVEAARRDHYEMFRGRERPYAGHLTDLALSLGVRIGVETVHVEAGAPAVGGNPRTLQIRSTTGCNVVAVIRGKDVIYEPSPDFGFRPDDVVVLVGTPEALRPGLTLFRAPPAVGAPAG